MKPCTDCGKPNFNEADKTWHYISSRCKPCHILYLEQLHSYCDKQFSDGCGKPIENKGYQRRCDDCKNAALNHVSLCYVCNEMKPGAGEYFLKLPDCGPGGMDVEEFCCKDCAENPIDAYFGRNKKLRGKK